MQPNIGLGISIYIMIGLAWGLYKMDRPISQEVIDKWSEQYPSSIVDMLLDFGSNKKLTVLGMLLFWPANMFNTLRRVFKKYF